MEKKQVVSNIEIIREGMDGTHMYILGTFLCYRILKSSLNFGKKVLKSTIFFTYSEKIQKFNRPVSKTADQWPSLS